MKSYRSERRCVALFTPMFLLLAAAMLLWPGTARAVTINCDGVSDFSEIQAALADDVTISLTGDCVAEVDESGRGQTLVIFDFNNVTIEGPAALAGC